MSDEIVEDADLVQRAVDAEEGQVMLSQQLTPLAVDLPALPAGRRIGTVDHIVRVVEALVADQQLVAMLACGMDRFRRRHPADGDARHIAISEAMLHPFVAVERVAGQILNVANDRANRCHIAIPISASIRVIEKGNPRLCRGDLKSLTNPGVV